MLKVKDFEYNNGYLSGIVVGDNGYEFHHSEYRPFVKPKKARKTFEKLIKIKFEEA